MSFIKVYKKDSIKQERALAYLVHNFSKMKDVVDACKLFKLNDINVDETINK